MFNPYNHQGQFSRYKKRQSSFDKIEEEINKRKIFRSPTSFTQRFIDLRKSELNQQERHYESPPKALNSHNQLVRYTETPKYENKRKEFKKSIKPPKIIPRNDEVEPKSWKSGKLFHSDEYDIDLAFVSLTSDDLVIGFNQKANTIHWCSKNKIHNIIE